MNVKSIEKEGSKAKITVEIEKDLMDSGANKAYLKARKDIQLPGFRKGKAPRKLIESIYGAHVFYEDGHGGDFPSGLPGSCCGAGAEGSGPPQPSAYGHCR